MKQNERSKYKLCLFLSLHTVICLSDSGGRVSSKNGADDEGFHDKFHMGSSEVWFETAGYERRSVDGSQRP